jgi:membrane protease YdiL (CAAX protease family)
MNDIAEPPRTSGRTLFEVLFTRRTTIAVISVVLLVAISALPNLGVIAGWVFILVALLACVRQGSFGEIGFGRAESWPRTILLAIAFGVVIQLVFSIVVDPLLARWTGTPVDVSSLDGMRGNLVNYLIMLAIGWVLGGFLEEMLFRGYLLKRIRIVLGDHPAATVIAVLLPALAFGLAHSYQDTAGMISTGLIGAILGALFVWYRGNLWLPILVHGFSNVVGITLIYTSGDRVLNTLLFG